MVEDARIFSELTGNPMKKTTKQANPLSPPKNETNDCYRQDGEEKYKGNGVGCQIDRQIGRVNNERRVQR